MGDKCEDGHQLRPHIVWFGEDVPNLPVAAQIVSESDAVIIVGTSLNVYPAASLIDYVQPNTPIYYIDPKPAIGSGGMITVIAKSATEGMKELRQILKTV